MEYQWFSVFDFYWVDMEENLRGYADSEEECRNQARNQKKAPTVFVFMVLYR
jgi:hypothetical protein